MIRPPIRRWSRGCCATSRGPTGGWAASAAVRFGLAQLLQPSDRGRTLTLFDIGTGAGDLPLDARRWARRRGVSIVPLGLERIPAAARTGAQRGRPGDSGLRQRPAAPRRERRHRTDQPGRASSRRDRVRCDCSPAASTVARRGVIVADLRPAWYAAPGFRLAGSRIGIASDHARSMASRRCGGDSRRRRYANSASRPERRTCGWQNGRGRGWWRGGGQIGTEAQSPEPRAGREPGARGSNSLWALSSRPALGSGPWAAIRCAPSTSVSFMPLQPSFGVTLWTSSAGRSSFHTTDGSPA